MGDKGIDGVSGYLEQVNEALDHFDIKKKPVENEISFNINHFKI